MRHVGNLTAGRQWAVVLSAFQRAQRVVRTHSCARTRVPSKRSCIRGRVCVGVCIAWAFCVETCQSILFALPCNNRMKQINQILIKKHFDRELSGGFRVVVSISANVQRIQFILFSVSFLVFDIKCDCSCIATNEAMCPPTCVDSSLIVQPLWIGEYNLPTAARQNEWKGENMHHQNIYDLIMSISVSSSVCGLRNGWARRHPVT